MRGNGRSWNRRFAAIFGGERAGRWAALAVLVGLCVAIGCATPEQRYRTLSIFFDDVPLPPSMRPPPEIEEAAGAQAEAPAPAKQPTFEWVIHDPDCDECHVSEDAVLPEVEPPDLCWGCHDEEDFVDEVLHGPFAAGACLQCHSPHKSQHASLLLRAPAELCEGCHDATTFAGLERHRGERGEDCVGCHGPHSGPEHYMLQERAAVAPAARTPDDESESGIGP